jgi:predicted ATPase
LRFAVFVDGCTVDAAEAVCGAPKGAEPLGIAVLEGLSHLVDHSLVQQREESGEPRFGMSHVIRKFALEQLEANGEAEALLRAHVEYYLVVAEDVGPKVSTRIIPSAEPCAATLVGAGVGVAVGASVGAAAGVLATCALPVVEIDEPHPPKAAASATHTSTTHPRFIMPRLPCWLAGRHKLGV